MFRSITVLWPNSLWVLGRFPFPVSNLVYTPKPTGFCFSFCGWESLWEGINSYASQVSNFFSELSWMCGGNSSPNQQHVFRPLLLLLFCQADLHQETWAPGEGSSADWASGLSLDSTDINNYKSFISRALPRVRNAWNIVYCSGSGVLAVPLCGTHRG